jgi:predicted pyridoxine 5'-phosphate oxidase superfamily flavin-nucleotide-binding protein
MIVIEFATRRRIRINGVGEIGKDSKIYIHTEQVYANCPKYIQARRWQTEEEKVQAQITVVNTNELSQSQMALIQDADTFFIASHHREGGADVSHRGGHPGFVRVENPQTLVFPDYAGNTMFQTLGNLTANPNGGLLFIDFSRGNTMQLTGTARIIWDTNRLQEFPGAERIIEFRLSEIIEISKAIHLKWEFESYSPFNPD